MLVHSYLQELLGSCECSLAEVVAQPHLATRGRMERPLVPYARRPGDCGLIYIYSEEQTQIKDVVTFQVRELEQKSEWKDRTPLTFEKKNSMICGQGGNPRGP